jgi:DNA polymerase I
VLCHPSGRTRGAHARISSPSPGWGPRRRTRASAFERLKGEGTFNWLAQSESLAAFGVFFKAVRDGAAIDVLKPYESQWLLQQRARQFAGSEILRPEALPARHRDRGDVEPGAFSDAKNPGDRVLAIGLQCGPRRELLTLGEETDAGEKRLLLEFNDLLREMDPDVVEGHNIFKFDLDYLRTRSKRHKVPCAWGRFGLTAEFRNSRMKVAERWIDFSRCDMPGRTIIDTYLLVQLYDITAREMTAYGLKDAARYFGITPESGEGRTYIDGAQIQHAFRATRAEFLAYLADDLRETRGLADVLLPTYFEQARAFPILLQEAALRGTAGKVDLLFLEEYYHARASCPAPVDIEPFEGGFTRSFQDGVFRHVLHFDVASLYPSLLLQMDRNPRSDTLGVFIPMLRRLREYRLRYKLLAKSAPTAAERDEAQARQATFKILINSFYGYLGFSGARFGDGELAAEVTRRGRELLQSLIEAFQKHGCTILEADTTAFIFRRRSISPGRKSCWPWSEKSSRPVSNWSTMALTTRCSATRRKTMRSRPAVRSRCAARPSDHVASSPFSSGWATNSSRICSGSRPSRRRRRLTASGGRLQAARIRSPTWRKLRPSARIPKPTNSGWPAVANRAGRRLRSRSR